MDEDTEIVFSQTYFGHSGKNNGEDRKEIKEADVACVCTHRAI